MRQISLDKYQLAGLDARARGFSRPVMFDRVGEGYRAILRYETILVETEPHSTQDDALCMLIQTLQTDGYRQLRTQMSFRSGVYLGSQELWVEYPDLVPEPEPPGFMARLLNWFRLRTTNE
jgi:hypothetical protein